jgi:hypothetical protein
MLSGRELELERARVTVCGQLSWVYANHLFAARKGARSEQVTQELMQMQSSVEATDGDGLCFAIDSSRLRPIRRP